MFPATADKCLKPSFIYYCFYGDLEYHFSFTICHSLWLIFTYKYYINISEFIMLLQQFIVGVNLYFYMYSERSVTSEKIKNTLQAI